MAAHNHSIVDVDLGTGTVMRSFVNRTLCNWDDEYNRFGIRAFRNGQPVSLNGCDVFGYFMRSDGNTVVIHDIDHSFINGNEAYIVLPKACYANEGQFTLAIKIVGSGVTGTVRVIDGTVINTSTGDMIDPGTNSIIPDLDDDYEVAAEVIEDAAAIIAQYRVEAVLVSGDNYDIQVTTPPQTPEQT